MVVTEGMQLRVDDGWTVSITVVQASFYRNRSRWYVRQRPEDADIVVFARMSGGGTAIEAFVFAPRVVRGAHPKKLSPSGFPDVVAYTFSLTTLAQLGHPSPLPSAGHTTDDDTNDLSRALAETAGAYRRHMIRVHGASEALLCASRAVAAVLAAQPGTRGRPYGE